MINKLPKHHINEKKQTHLPLDSYIRVTTSVCCLYIHGTLLGAIVLIELLSLSQSHQTTLLNSHLTLVKQHNK